MKIVIVIDSIDVKKVDTFNSANGHMISIELPNDFFITITPHTLKYIAECLDTITKKQIEGELNESNS